MRDIDTIIIHCSATPPKMDIGASTIDQWHRGRGWDAIGYHYVIRRDGKLEHGRPIQKQGAHAKGHNANSIGICMVGGVKAGDTDTAEDNFTAAQWVALEWLVSVLEGFEPKIIGHNEVSEKACPSFNVQEWLNRRP